MDGVTSTPFATMSGRKANYLEDRFNELLKMKIRHRLESRKHRRRAIEGSGQDKPVWPCRSPKDRDAGPVRLAQHRHQPAAAGAELGGKAFGNGIQRCLE